MTYGPIRWATPFVALLLGGCVAVDNSGPVPLGRIVRIDGPNAFVETGGQTMRATPGQRLFEGDRFFTGDGSHETVALRGGGEIELDVDTDPGLFQETGCLAIRLFHLGRIFVRGQQICTETGTDAVIQHSEVVYQIIQPATLRITVVGGQVQTLRPAGFTVTPGYRLDLRGPVALRGGPYPLTTGEVREAVGWTDYYQRFQPSLPGFDPQPPGRGPGRPRPFPRPRPTPTPTPTPIIG